MECPVCGLDHIPIDEEICPQCDSDLSCFKVLGALGEVLSDTHPQKASDAQEEGGTDSDLHKESNYIPLILLGIILGSSMGILLLGYHVFETLDARVFGVRQSLVESENKVVRQLDRIEQILLSHLADADHAAAQYRQELIGSVETWHPSQKDPLYPCSEKYGKSSDEAKSNDIRPGQEPNESDLDHRKSDAWLTGAKPEYSKIGEQPMETDELKLLNPVDETLCIKIYHAHESDTLWHISEILYGSGHWYPVLLLYNPDLAIYRITGGEPIRYLCNKSIIPKLYYDYTFRKTIDESSGLFFKYTVRKGDTVESLQKRYCAPNRENSPCILQQTLPEPGKKIVVRLE